MAITTSAAKKKTRRVGVAHQLELLAVWWAAPTLHTPSFALGARNGESKNETDHSLGSCI